jgi:hypothetical protein
VANRIEIKTITVPAATLEAAPQTTALTWREGFAERVEIRIPPGPSGLVGVALSRSGRQVIPHDETEWLITDAEAVVWPLEEYGTSAKWSVQAYNLDIYDHIFQVRMLFRELRSPAPEPPPPVEIVPPNPSDESEQDFPEYTLDLEEVTG